MRLYSKLLVSVVVGFWACSPAGDENKDESSSTKASHHIKDNESDSSAFKANQHALPDVVFEEGELMIGERIDGPANVRDTVDGRILYSLLDGYQVDCYPVGGEWYELLVLVELNPEESSDMIIDSGSNLVWNGKRIGVAMAELNLLGRGAIGDTLQYGMLEGYTHRANIREGSILEKEVEQQASRLNFRIQEWKPLIREFELEFDDESFGPFQGYSTYETSVHDPSPGFRIALLFEEEQFAGIFHSRPLDINGMATRSLTRGYMFSYFPQALSVGKVDEFARHMKWLDEVD